MKAVRDAAILLILVVLALTVRVSPVQSDELAPLNRASLADLGGPRVERPEAHPAAVAAPVERPDGPICAGTNLEETQVFVFELNEVIDTLSEVVQDEHVKTVVRRLELAGT